MLEQWVRHLENPEDLRKRAERCQKSCRKAAKWQTKKGYPKRPGRPPSYHYSVCTDRGPIALRTFRSMHIEAMNRTGMGSVELQRRLVFRRMR